MFRTTNVQNKWKIGPSEGILFHFPPETPFSAGNAPALTSPAKRSAAPSPAGVRSVVPRVDPFGFRIDPFGFRIAPFGSCMIPLRPAPSLSRPILTPARLPLLYPGARITHSCSRVAPAATPFARQSRHGGEEQKKSAFFWSIRKIFTTFTPYCSNNLVSAPQRFARRIRLSSHPGIPMTGDVPAAGSEQHTETTYLSIFNQKTQKHEKIRHPSPDVVLCAHCRSAG